MCVKNIHSRIVHLAMILLYIVMVFMNNKAKVGKYFIPNFELFFMPEVSDRHAIEKHEQKLEDS